MELMPLMVIDDDAPGTPDVLVTSTPAIRPCNELMKFSRCASAIILAPDGLLSGSQSPLRSGLS